MPTPRFTMVVLNVADLARSAAFYRRLGVGHHLVLTTTFARNVPEYGPPPGDTRVMLEFFVDGDAAVDVTYAELVGAGYHGRREPFRTDFGAWMALVDDPGSPTGLVPP